MTVKDFTHDHFVMLSDRFAPSVQKYNHLKEITLPFVCWLSSHMGSNPNPNPSSFGFLSGTVRLIVRARNNYFCSVIMNAPAAIIALK